jgi:hypothetical protein
MRIDQRHLLDSSLFCQAVFESAAKLSRERAADNRFILFANQVRGFIDLGQPMTR